MRDSVLLKPGDMAVSCYDGRHGTRSESRFPLGCYEGLCLEVDPAAAQNWLEKNAPGFSVDFAVLKQNLLGNRWFMFGTAGPRCEHVFRELYENAPYMDLRFLRLKVVELLMLLSRIPQEEGTDLYCSTVQTELAHHLRDHLLTNREGYRLPWRSWQEEARDLLVSHLQKNVQTGLRCASIPLYQGIPSGTGCRRACPERKAQLRRSHRMQDMTTPASFRRLPETIWNDPVAVPHPRKWTRKTEQGNQNGVVHGRKIC